MAVITLPCRPALSGSFDTAGRTGVSTVRFGVAEDCAPPARGLGALGAGATRHGRALTPSA
ncbi:hypothetical protein ABZ845_08180 [Streptomyces sp. NPDC047022]|uniref:hypothetical protein n=1 Tax=Streptomyces sp. NPDC047022 TaxID=3155737 RepID=UPI0033F734ED